MIKSKKKTTNLFLKVYIGDMLHEDCCGKYHHTLFFQIPMSVQTVDLMIVK